MTVNSSAERARRGFTLLEMLVVVLILVAVAGMVITMTGDVGEQARRETTLASLARIREAVAKYYADVASMPQSVADLLRRRTNPLPGVPELPPGGTGPGWRGPYLLHAGAVYAADLANGFRPEYGPAAPGLPLPPALKDAWGRPIVLQIPNAVLEDPEGDGLYRLVSAGPDGVIDTPHRDEDVLPPATRALFPSRSQCDDDLILYLRQADLRP